MTIHGFIEIVIAGSHPEFHLIAVSAIVEVYQEGRGTRIILNNGVKFYTDLNYDAVVEQIAKASL
jgi:hypothetical protein